MIFENANIYHDASAIAYFGKQMENYTATSFCGKEYRTNAISCAILLEQFNKLDSIIADLKKNQMALREKLAPYCTFAPSNDIEGDLGTTIAIQFETEEAARKFGTYEGVNCGLPIDTGKHVYTNWSCIMEKKGALNPLMDPFKFEANRNIIPEYTRDMCPKSLDILSRAINIPINPDATEEELDAIAEKLLNV
jgi:dTDP-4-amino-4,6-dideoxygalactose transaminase